MKRIITCVVLAAICSTTLMAQKKVSILGDSYSTFEGLNPNNYSPFYPNDRNDVTKPEETWWMQFIETNGYKLEKNNSWGGTTISTTGYGRSDSSSSTFLTRMLMLGNPDIIFVFGGTNDAWAGVPMGEYQYENWKKEDLKNFRPAAAYMLSQLKMFYPNAEIYYLLNSELKDAINESSKEICEHYGVPMIAFHDIEKQNGHPSIKGMKAICDQINEFIAAQK